MGVGVFSGPPLEGAAGQESISLDPPTMTEDARKVLSKAVEGLKKATAKNAKQAEIEDPLEKLSEEETIKFLSEFKKLKHERRLLTAEDLQKIQIHFADQGGYQRKIQQKKVDEIAALLRYNVPFPGILVARTPNGMVYFVDGHHRALGVIAAGVSINADIIYCDLDIQARWLFILHNFHATKIKFSHLLKVSRNPVADQIRSLAKKFNASEHQVRRLLNGIVGGLSTNGLDLVGVAARIPEVRIKLAEEVLRLWTNSNLWMRLDGIPRGKTKESVFSGMGTLHLAGAICRETWNHKQRRETELKALYNANWNVNTELAKLHGTTISAISDMKNYFTAKILRGMGPRPCPEDHKRIKKTVSSKKTKKSA